MSLIAQLSDLADPTLTPRLVLKVGSSLLVDNAGARREWLTALVSEIAAAKARGQDVIVVSSGAIALGRGGSGWKRAGAGRWPMRRPPPPWARSRCRACGLNSWARMV